MPHNMTHWERVRAALEGAPVDRPPMSMWRHFYHWTLPDALPVIGGTGL